MSPSKTSCFAPPDKLRKISIKSKATLAEFKTFGKGGELAFGVVTIEEN